MKKRKIKVEPNDALAWAVIEQALAQGLAVIRVDKDKPNWFYEGEGVEKKIIMNIRACRVEPTKESSLIAI